MTLIQNLTCNLQQFFLGEKQNKGKKSSQRNRFHHLQKKGEYAETYRIRLLLVQAGIYNDTSAHFSLVHSFPGA